jgi:hypothetical protein
MEELFNLIKNYGYIIRKNNLNGLTNWNEMKDILSNISCNCLSWNINLVNLDKKNITSISDAYNYVHDYLDMKGEDDQTEKCNPNWEKFHFFLQLVRIPYNNPDCNLVRLAQIAYNLGQLDAVYFDDIYTPSVRTFYNMNNLDKMSAYTENSCDISKEDLEKIRLLMDSKIIGSGYLYKYLNKYLKYKKNILS